MDENHSGLPPEEQEPKKSENDRPKPGQSLFEWLQMCIICILGAVFIFNCVARLSRVTGHSMDQTLQHGELMLVWSLGYTPKQGDVVVLNKTTAEFLGGPGGEAIVKRVIATGGQTVDIDYESSTVYVDGQPLDEPYLWEEMRYPEEMGWYQMTETHFEVPDGSIFVMGDNRNGSTDSRHELLGAIDEDYVMGKACLALAPLSRFGAIK